MNFASLQKTALAISLSLTMTSSAFAQAWLPIVDYTKLKNELGATLETGAGVEVALAEADLNANATIRQFLPDPASPAFVGKTITNASAAPGFTDTISSHATAVTSTLTGQTGNTIAPGVTQIFVFDAADWIITRAGAGTNNPPLPNPYSVHNHSYIANGLPLADAEELNARFDFLMDRDDTLSLVGENNGASSNLPQLAGQSYNAIAVGRSDGGHSRGLTTLSGSGRIKPELVTPGSSTSLATAIATSAAILLQARANALGAADGRTMEVKKAVLLAGATKAEFPEWNQIFDTSGVVTRPLDDIFGAGELSIYNSYFIMSGGEWGGDINAAPSSSGPLRAWDYGESLLPGEEMFWNIQIPEGKLASEVSILLTWNADYSDSSGNFTLTRTLPNMRLRLWNSTQGFKNALIADSNSSVDNIEHISLKNLGSGTYTMGVTTSLPTDFGIAWHFHPLQDISMPKVGLTQVGDGPLQRSMVNRTQVVFEGLMDIDDNAFTVIKRGTGGGSVATTVQLSTVNNNTVATLSYSGNYTRANGNLVDGNYQLTIDAQKVRRRGTTILLDGDFNGLPGGNYVFGTKAEDRFFAYFGDSNGDRIVSSSEFNAFRSTFGKSAGDPAFNPLFDFDGDNSIGTIDFNALRLRYGRLLSFE